MRRGELYRAGAQGTDPRRYRIYLLVSRQALIDSRYSTIRAVPVYSNVANVPTEVPIGPESGLAAPSWLRCDEVTGIARSAFRQYVGRVNEEAMRNVAAALRVAMDLDEDFAE